MEAFGNGAIIEQFKNTWGFTAATIGTYGEDFILRAGVSRIGVAANSPAEAMYMMLIFDNGNNLLDGHNRYRVTFKEGQQPPSDAFWSLTVYQHSNNGLVGNEINRYSVGDRTPGLHYEADGSLTIYIQHEAPEGDKAKNRLPIPKGPFYMLGRSYQPKQELLDMEWEPPMLEKY